MNNMFDLKDKSLTVTRGSVYPNLFVIQDYIPFSLLFNLQSDQPTIERLIAKYDCKLATNTMKSMFIDPLTDWINDIPFNMVVGRYRRDTVTTFYQTFSSDLGFRSSWFVRQRTYYTKGYYSLFSSNLGQCYFILMIKKEYIKYVKLCAILNEPILEDCFEFWYDEDLINTNPEFVKIHKRLLKDLTTMEVPCIKKSKIIDLLTPKIEFQAPTIGEQKEKLNEFTKDFQKVEIESEIR